MKRVFLFFLFLLATSLILTAQTRIITGTGTGAEDNKPVTGCTVQLKGTTTGILTDTEGKDSLPVPQNSTSLTFSYIGMKSQDVVIGGTQQVTGDAIATVKTSNFRDSLSGKLSGVVIKRNQNLGGNKCDSSWKQIIPKYKPGTVC